MAVDDLAAAVLELAVGYRARPLDGAGPMDVANPLEVAGLLNVAGPEAVSRAALGRLVAAALRPRRVGDPHRRGRRVRPGPPDPVVLDVSRANGLLTTRLRPVSEVYPPASAIHNFCA